jgi:YVTN family beta-propeller protein
VLDAATGAVIATVQTGSNVGSEDSYQGIAASPDGKRVYAVDPNTAMLSTIDAGTNTLIATSPLGGVPYGVAVSPDSKYVYVTNSSDGTLSVIPVA